MTLERKFFILASHRFPKAIQFGHQICVTFGKIYLCEQLCSLAIKKTGAMKRHN